MQHKWNYIYKKKPGYLSLRGNISSVSADMRISILVWPSFMCKGVLEYGLALYDDDNDIGYLMYVDEKMQFDQKKSTGLTAEGTIEAKRLLKELGPSVLLQYNEMKNEFGYN